MTIPVNLYNRQDPNTPEKLLLERLEIILRKDFIGGFVEEEFLEENTYGYSELQSLDDAYSNGAQEVKRYLSDALGIYAFERKLYAE